MAVIIKRQSASQILWKRMFRSPMIIAKKETRMTNFASFKKVKICLILPGLKLKIKKNRIRYQPQNLARKREV